MKPKPNKNLSLHVPWTPQQEKASGNHQILLPRNKARSLTSPIIMLITISLSGFVFPGVMHQFFDVADRGVVHDTW